MIQQKIAMPTFQRIPIILLPLIALIGTIASFHLLISYDFSYLIIVILYSLLITLIGIPAYYIPTIRTIAALILITILCGLFRSASLYHSYHSFPFSNEPATIQGTVLNKVKTDQPHMSQYIVVALTSVHRETSSLKTNHLIRIYVAIAPDLEVGDRVKIDNIPIKKPNNDNFWQYLIKEGTLTTIFTKKLEWTLLYRPTYSVRRWFFTYKNNLLSSFQSQLSPATFHLFASLFLGVKNKKALETVNRQFKYWGILHYLARSGLHLAVVIAIYEAVLRFIPLPFIAQHLLLLLLGILYYLLSWSSISFIRAFIMFLYYKLSALAQIPTHFLHILLATCYIILLTNPMHLFFLDFQLSFCLTFALGWLNLYKTDQITPNSVKY
ncbi:DUF4131 domain-containing protein [Candidatus Dependentiae bacterium]|nr:MAG: DUF4131 domain-containing protein [Candidatus Dependentiae bacterium]